MTAVRRSAVAVSVRLYALLLRLYPAEFRVRFRTQMMGAFRDACHEQIGEHGLTRGPTIWGRELWGLLRESASERVRLWRARSTRAAGQAGSGGPLGPRRPVATRPGDSLLADIKFAFRGLRRNPGFTAVVVLTLALGIGANTAIFSVMRTVLLRPFPYPEADELVTLWTPKPGFAFNPLSAPDWLDYQASSRSFSALGAYEQRRLNVSGDADPERVSGIRCTAGLLRALGAQPAHGRLFRDEETADPAGQVAIVSDHLWKSRFGADSALVGRQILVNQESLTVIGILPSGFRFPGWGSLREPDILVPLALEGQVGDRGSYYLSVIGRLREGVSVEGADEEMKAIAARLAESYPDTNYRRIARVVPLRTIVLRGAARNLWILFGIVGFVLLIACTNVAGLLMARNTGRNVEMAIRSSMGAGRPRLLRQMLTESSILALFGGAVALLVAWWGIGVLRTLIPSNLPRADELGIDLHVVVFAFGAALLTGLLFGIVPALQASGIDLSRSLREGALTVTARRAQTRFLLGVIIAQLALTFVLTSGAGLMLQSLWNATGSGELHGPEQVLIAAYSRDSGRGEEIIITDPFQDQLLERVRALPGVLSAGATTRLPLQTGWTAGIMPEGHTHEPEEANRYFTYIGCASPDYLGALGVDLLQGRDLLPQDSMQGSLGVLVNRTYAEQAWPEESPLGKRVQGGFTADPWFEAAVVGVFDDVRQNGLEEGTEPEIYLPFFPGFQRSRYLAIRTEGDPMALVSALRSELADLDPHVPLASVSTAADIYDSAATSRRFSTLLIGLFAIIAVCLVTAGTYGATAFLVRQRNHEVGIRIALGADHTRVLGLVLGQSFRMVLAGIALGLLGTAAASSIIGSLLYGIGPLDPVALALAALFLLLVVLAATLVPAIRAVRVDPVEAMRSG